MWVVESLCATVADYMAMVRFMRKPFVAEAFVTYSRRRQLQMCCLIHKDEEVNVRNWFPTYSVEEIDDDIMELDQSASIEACMLIGLSGCDLIQTKNLKNTRLRLCERLDMTCPDASIVIEE